MSRHSLPRIAALSGPEVARARRLVVHSPAQTDSGALCWALTLLEDDGRPLAEGRATSPDYPVPLSEIVQVHLDVVGLALASGWRSEAGPGERPRYSAEVVVRPAADG